MEHHFDIELAERYGILEAVLLNHFQFWIAKNKANGSNYHDGRYWTYNSTRALQELFPYVSQRKIQNALKHLIEEGVLVTGNYNKSSYDRTLWYAFTDYGKCITQKREMEKSKKGNGSREKGKPIPDNNTDKDTDNITDNIYIPVIAHLNEVCGTNYRASAKETRRFIKARYDEGFTLNDFFTVIDKKASTWIGTEFEQYLRPRTLFGPKFESYLNERVRPKNGFLELLKETEG